MCVRKILDTMPDEIHVDAVVVVRERRQMAIIKRI
jgi:hypothetical protein